MPDDVTWEDLPDDVTWEDLRRTYSRMCDEAVLFGFARTPDGSPFLATQREDGSYLITDAKEPQCPDPEPSERPSISS